MTGQYRIRPVDGSEEEHADTLELLHRLTFFDTAPLAKFDQGAWWIAYQDKEPIGFCGVTPSTYRRNTGYLKRAAVLREHRGHRLQRRFVRVRENYARKHGWEALYTDTVDYNVGSSNNLIACGYKLFEPEPRWNGDHFLYWRKML